MRLALMQPYFFPYLGYFSLIAATDRWVAYDTPQFPREGWVKRNRVLTMGGSAWKYVGIPVVRGPLDTPIHAVRIDSRVDWRGDILRNLDYYREHRAPYYRETLEFLQRTLHAAHDGLSALLVSCLRATCDHVGLPARIEVFSELNLEVEPTETPQDRVVAIARALEATTYVNLPGGKDLYDRRQFALHGIELLFVAPGLPPYDQHRGDFIPGLSIIDALMWNSPGDVRTLIQNYGLVP